MLRVKVIMWLLLWQTTTNLLVQVYVPSTIKSVDLFLKPPENECNQICHGVFLILLEMNNINNFLDPFTEKSFWNYYIGHWGFTSIRKPAFNKPVLRKWKGLLKLRHIFVIAELLQLNIFILCCTVSSLSWYSFIYLF